MHCVYMDRCFPFVQAVRTHTTLVSLQIGIHKGKSYWAMALFMVLVFLIGLVKVMTINSFYREGLTVKVGGRHVFLDFGVKDVIVGDEKLTSKIWVIAQGVGVLVLACLSFVLWWWSKIGDHYSNIPFKSLLKQPPSTIRFFTTLQKVESTTWEQCVKAAGIKKDSKLSEKEKRELVVAQVYSNEANLKPM